MHYNLNSRSNPRFMKPPLPPPVPYPSPPPFHIVFVYNPLYSPPPLHTFPPPGSQLDLLRVWELGSDADGQNIT
jgi:hypothetical protein